MLAPSAARWLLVLHTGLGVAAVATGTHLLIWLRRYLRGAVTRRSVIKFAAIFVALQSAAFVAGNVMYPTYKVEVRTAYLENPHAIVAEEGLRTGAVADAPATADLVQRAAQAARWFDVKEHWIALGLIASAAVLLILAFWDPTRDGLAFSPIVVGLTGIACATVWLGAIIGVLTAAWRAV